MRTKFHVENIYSNWDIYVKKIKMMKVVLNSYFLRNKAIYYNKDMIRWRTKIMIFHFICSFVACLYAVNSYRKESV